jgi:metal-responsive CopG/Arc/MetJ family transcriptional regulator
MQTCYAYLLRHFIKTGSFKMARINISVPDSFLSKIDQYKKIRKVNRSQFLVNAATAYFLIIDDQEANEKRVRAMESLLKTREEISKYFKGKKIDVVEEIRKMREERMQTLEDTLNDKAHGTK